MYRIDHTLLRFATVIAAILLQTIDVVGQESATASDAGSAVVSALNSEPRTVVPTVSELMLKRTAAGSGNELDEATRTAIDQHYAKAIEHLQAAEQATSQASILQQELDTAPQRIAEMQQELVTTVAAPSYITSEPLSFDAAQFRLNEREAALKAAKTRLQKIVTEMERRAVRRPQLSELRLQATKEIEDAKAAIASPVSEHAVLDEARLIRLAAQRLRFAKEIELIDQESRTYEVTTRYWTLQRDLSDRAMREAEKSVTFWQERVAEAQKQQAAEETALARRAAAQAHPAVKGEAALNSSLAQEHATIVTNLESSQKRLNQVDSELSTRQEAFDGLKRRAIAAHFSQAIGVLLRNQQAALPDTDEFRWNSRRRQIEIGKLNLRLMELDVERRRLVDLDAAIKTSLSEIVDKTIDYGEVEESLRAMLTSRLTLLGDLIENGNTYLDRLVRLDCQERELIRLIDDESGWLAEHVLWVRSAGLIGRGDSPLQKSLRTFANPVQWRSVWEVLNSDLFRAPWWLLLATIPCTFAIIVRRRIKNRIQSLGIQARRANCVDFLSTLESASLTLLLAGPLPLIAWVVGWRLSSVGLGNQFVESVGFGMQVMAGCWLLVAIVRSICQVDGIGEDHFDWPSDAMSSVRRSTRLLLLALLPTSFIVGLIEYYGDEQASSSLGRIAYLSAMAMLTVEMFRMFRPTGKIFQSIESNAKGSLMFRFRWLLSGLLIAGPGTLAAMSAIGFHYTAIQLTGRLLASLSCGFAVVVANAFASRWLLVTYRRLAIRRAREKRQKLAAQQEIDADQTVVVDTTPELKLSDINSQARRVIRLVAATLALSALYVAWVDVMPAFGILQKIQLWHNNLVTVEDTNEIVWVTAADILIAMFFAAMTIFASRNLPGLLEMTVLQRLPLDAGARYAATTVSRYLIFIAGTFLCFHEIGIGWSSVQWLIAAMTVGLGFGLQEIFANFVSGIILLFERPVRLGDTVTIGAINGTVTRIRIRATTIVDWDNKELIVPNKEFVTGQLVNWTLTNPTLRLTLTVGVAYGSNTRLTTDLLYRVAKQIDSVLADPEPVVVFKEFADSCLNFELRVFVSGLTAFRCLRHELNLAIDDLFREHQIEIAFPQRDLHVRSLPAELIALFNQRKAEATSVSTEDVPVDQVRAA